MMTGVVRGSVSLQILPYHGVVEPTRVQGSGFS